MVGGTLWLTSGEDLWELFQTEKGASADRMQVNILTSCREWGLSEQDAQEIIDVTLTKMNTGPARG